MPQKSVLEEDFTDDVKANVHLMKQLFSRLDKPWTLTTGTVVEEKMMEMLLSNPVNTPFTLAAYCTMGPNDPIYSVFSTEAELQEISATVAPIRLRVENLD